MKSLECSLRRKLYVERHSKSVILENGMLSVATFLGFETATNSLRKIKFSSGSCLVWELKPRNKG